MINWSEYRRIYSEMSLVETTLLKKTFREYLAGNSCYDNASDSELSLLYDGFVAGWVCIETMIKRTDPDM